MDPSQLAKWASRGIAAAGFIAAMVSLFFNYDLTDKQLHNLDIICGGIILVGWPAYEAWHAKAVAHKDDLKLENTELHKQNVSLSAAVSGTASTIQTGATS